MTWVAQFLNLREFQGFLWFLIVFRLRNLWELKCLITNVARLITAQQMLKRTLLHLFFSPQVHFPCATYL